jgi:parvulin-like peptidyl-prolyl isomerase
MSEGPNAARGGVIGTFGRGDLFDPALERAVFALEAGEVSEPVLTPRGVHLVRLDAVTADGRRRISQIFFSMSVTEADVQTARARIDAAVDRVRAGESFSLVAEDVSEDPTSARRGGRLGTFALEDLSPQFQEALATAAAGEITEPILTPAGWYVFRIDNRREGHRLTFDEVREQLRAHLEAQKLEEELAHYVDGLRERFFVEEKS